MKQNHSIVFAQCLIKYTARSVRAEVRLLKPTKCKSFIEQSCTLTPVCFSPSAITNRCNADCDPNQLSKKTFDKCKPELLAFSVFKHAILMAPNQAHSLKLNDFTPPLHRHFPLAKSQASCARQAHPSVGKILSHLESLAQSGEVFCENTHDIVWN